MDTAAAAVTPARVREVLARHLNTQGMEIVPDLARSHGSWLADARDGREYLDFFTYYATLAVGHNHPRLAGPELVERLGRAAVQKVSLSDAYPVEEAVFVEAFARTALPRELPHVFFIEGGALAVENALKTAFDWKVRKNLARGRGERGQKVLHFRQAFHGRSGYTLSLTNTADLRKIQYFPKLDWPRVPNPRCVFPLEGGNLERVRAEEQESLAEVRRILEGDAEDVAALILEPIQCEGGDNHFRGEFLAALRRLCDEHEVFYVLDEVQTGFGATGAWWCFQHFGFTPDAVAFGKKAQAAGILVSRRVEEVPDHAFAAAGRINSTWGGNLVDMVRATAILEVIEREGLVRNARERGEELLALLRGLEAELPGRISNVRGRGLLAAFDLPSAAGRNALQVRLREKGLLALRCGERSIRFRPALSVTSAECQEAAARTREALRETT